MRAKAAPLLVVLALFTTAFQSYAATGRVADIRRVADTDGSWSSYQLST